MALLLSVRYAARMLDQLIEETKREFPDFKIVRKSDSTLMKAINVFLLIVTFGMQRTFMTAFTTTLGTTVYITDAWDTWGEITRVMLLRHERVHMRQARRYTRPLFSLLYLFVFFPIGLAYFRMKFEKEAYEETIAAAIEYRGKAAVVDDDFREKIIGHFTSAEYVWMWPFRKGLERWYDGAVKKALNHAA